MNHPSHSLSASHQQVLVSLLFISVALKPHRRQSCILACDLVRNHWQSLVWKENFEEEHSVLASMSRWAHCISSVTGSYHYNGCYSFRFGSIKLCKALQTGNDVIAKIWNDKDRAITEREIVDKCDHINILEAEQFYLSNTSVILIYPL